MVTGVVVTMYSPHAAMPFDEMTPFEPTSMKWQPAGTQTSPENGALNRPSLRSTNPGPSGGPSGTPAVMLASPSGTVKSSPPPNLNSPLVRNSTNPWANGTSTTDSLPEMRRVAGSANVKTKPLAGGSASIDTAALPAICGPP